MRNWIIYCGLLVMSASCASGEAPAGAGGTGVEAPPAGQPAENGGAGRLDERASVEQILQALHARGADLRDFTTTVSMAQTDALTGDTTTLAGRAWYQARGEENGRLRVTFDSRKVGPRTDRSFRLDYLLAEGWLIERDHKNRLEVHRQVLKPGQKMNLLKLGEGPFPLPIGQEPSEVHRLFAVEKLEAGAEAPEGTVGLQLIPRPGSQFERKFKSLEAWVDGASRFPRRIRTIDPNETEIRTTDLTGIEINQGLEEGSFVLEKVEGFDRKVEPMGVEG